MMGFYYYQALTAEGLKKKGLVEALSLEEAQRSLFAQDLLVSKIEPVLKKSALPQKRELFILTEELAKLIDASLPLFEALLFLKEKYQRSHLFFFLSHLTEEVKKGRLLSQAMASFSSELDLLYIAMLESGEKAGRLNRSLNEAALFLKKELELRKKIFSALSYPLFLIGFCLAVLLILFFFVLPSLFELFEGRHLHPLTQIVFALSRFLNRHLAGFIFFSLFAVAAASACFLIKSWKNIFWGFIFKRTFFRGLFLQAALVRFSRTFALLLASGVSYLEALKLSAAVARHPLLEKEIREAEKKVTQGVPLSKSFLASSLIPPLMQRMVELAEESADMSGMIGKAADLMEEDLEKKISHLTGLLGPALLVFLGLLVGGVVLSVLIPLTDAGAFLGEN
ncbi:MAG: type II secretion system F family protein [Parachlamydiales bacterium]|jgi:general secretion pathway protein F/type IV pilus assembly protein PilC